jgi:hypothetical protein
MLRAGLFARIEAAEGFIFPSDHERRERYTEIISGFISQIHSLNLLWTVDSLKNVAEFLESNDAR